MSENADYIHWKPVKALGGRGYPYNDLECSGCGYRTKMIPEGWLYCPHCGKPVEIKVWIKDPVRFVEGE